MEATPSIFIRANNRLDDCSGTVAQHSQTSTILSIRSTLCARSIQKSSSIPSAQAKSEVLTCGGIMVCFCSFTTLQKKHRPFHIVNILLEPLRKWPIFQDRPNLRCHLQRVNGELRRKHLRPFFPHLSMMGLMKI